LAYDALHQGGNKPCILNAANEIAVQAFLEDEIGFLQMSDLVEETLNSIVFKNKLSYLDYVNCDAEARTTASQLIKSKKF
jgi:1-deoxy-D-xylulose-5-phosphate reductoisomerase